MNDKKVKTDPAANARIMRRARAKRTITKVGVFVGMPTFVALVYFGLIASDVFESSAAFTVQTAEARPAMGIETLLGGMTGSVSTRDSLVVQEYILSREMLGKLIAEHEFLQHYGSDAADWWSRLPGDSTREEAFEYYLDHVTIKYETLSGVLSMGVRAYSAEKAKAFADAILEYSEVMVNKLSERARLDHINFGKSEVLHAEERVATAQQNVLKLQNEGAEFLPSERAESALSVRTKLEIELANTRAELSEALSIMHPNAPKVVAFRQRARALEKQIAREDRKLVGTDKSGLNLSIMQFESAMMEKEFAEKQYQSAMASLEMAKMEAARQSRYLATIAPPSEPDEATHPKRLIGILTVFLVSLAVFGILSLMVAAVREHARL